ncbi:7TM-DISM domain-containing protein [Crocosphaera sp. UHCC 0190]|uniref:hybrid sensor histidine kinase/response regulator n=1 Tax=Crocosphaera sp. UHCC 0190 TaxID=3110246 RepID=UPI002B1F7025|nr:7TM-DISM domain-containing protein [Crocosphaera sp. UHCC 0190]MEA5509622.1 7TM-DISM domain-containing protein [Crocosphaera sp. UHCC 0190]
MPNYAKLIRENQKRIRLLSLLLAFLLAFLLLLTLGQNKSYSYSVKSENRPIILKSNKIKYPISLNLDILEDKSRELTIKEIISPEYSSQFIPNHQETPNLGFSKSNFWVRFSVKNEADIEKKWLLVLSDARMTYIQFYVPSQNKSGFVVKETGKAFPFKSRDIPHHSFVFNLPLAQGEETTFYLRFSSISTVFVPLTVWQREAFFLVENQQLFFLGLCYGMLIIMVAYNLFLFLALQDQSYLYYVLFVIGLTLHQSLRQGFFEQYIISEYSNKLSIHLFSIIAIILALKFATTFLDLKSTIPLLYKIILGLQVVEFIQLFLLPIFPHLIAEFHTFLILFVIQILLISGILSYKRGYRPARFYLLAMIVPFVSFFISNLSSFHLIPTTSWIFDSQLTSVVILVLFYSLALADRINLIKKEKTEALFLALETSQKHEKLIQEQNIILENKVNQRTQKLQKREIQLRKSKEKAEAANQAKNIFIANMSHELRTPLNAILGFSQLMNRSDKLSPDYQENINIIYHSGEYLLTLINHVLNLSKIEAGKFVLDLTNIDFHELLDELKNIFILSARNKGLNLRFTKEPNVPQWIKTDVTKLKEVLINILGNAIKFTPSGSVSLRVSREKNNLIFEIEDTGIGIAQAELENIFKSFYQCQNYPQSQEGTGLGLTISDNFIKLMGGKITVQSVIGKGTTFRFFIELIEVKHHEIKSPVNQQRVIGLEPKQPHYKILIVDDNIANRRLLLKLLQPLEFSLKEAANGQEAIEIWQEWHPDLIFMDIRMPVMDGFEATKQIKATSQENKTIIIAVTASVLEEKETLIYEVGCDGLIRKPFNDIEIFEALHQYLGVRYVYESSVETQLLPTSEDFLTPQDLKQLPQAWLDKMYEAIYKGDIMLASELITEISRDYPVLGQQLTQLLDNYEFEQLLTLTEQGIKKN